MNKLRSLLCALAAFGASLLPRRDAIVLANAATTEAFFPDGRPTLLTDGALAQKHLLVKRGSDDDHVAAAGVSDQPLGVVPDEATAAEKLVPVAVLGAVKGTLLGVASGAILAKARLVPGAAGTVRTLPATTGTYWVVGTALRAAADTARVSFIPTTPYPVVVP